MRVPRVEATDVSVSEALASLLPRGDAKGERASAVASLLPRGDAKGERASPVRVSTNWQDDYYDKLRDYESMGIPEYWIVDYAALGGRDFIGYPKQPTIFVCELIDGEYVKTMFRGNDLIKSPTFPQLNLTIQQVFNSGV